MTKKKIEQDFAKGFVELEAIAAWFEKGESDLEEGLLKFERATELAKGLKERLASAENRIREIKNKVE